MPAQQTISAEDIRKIARLAKLRLDASQVGIYTEQINAILEHVQELEGLEVDGVEPLSHVLDMTNVSREDRTAPSLERDKVLGNAPVTEAGPPEKRATDGEFILVPRVIQADP
ncbi:MAG: Asp-tRNA(Asn)/Glu-tRNA(Gln) amidotransferase subunit GatC [Candidatus Neomarinimicrobiota bacterium]